MIRASHKNPSHSWQAGRWFEALSPDSFSIDDRGSAELIAFAGMYSKLLTYFDASDNEDGDWSAFFQQDVSFLLAEICSVDATSEYRMTRRYENFEFEQCAVAALSRIRGWEIRAEELAIGRSPDSVERSLLESLKDSIQTEHAGLLDVKTLDILTPDPSCPPDPGNAEYFANQVEELNSQQESENALREQIPDDDTWRLIYSAVNRATERLSLVAKRYLKRSLTEKTDHPPHTALFLAFSQLFRHSIVHLNQITERHLDYYYHDVLRLQPRLARPDQVPVCFELNNQAQVPVVLDSGTRLSADDDAEGRSLIFLTDRKLSVGRTRVVALQAINVQRDRRVKDGPKDGPVARTLGVNAVEVIDSEDGRGASLVHRERGWRPFGRKSVSVNVDGQLDFGRDASLGIAVASPLLLMREGIRTIRLSIQFDPNADSTLKQALDALKNRYQHIESCIPDQNFESDGPFRKLFADSFSIDLSGSEGAFSAKASCDAEAIDIASESLVLTIRLDSDAPPIVPPPPAVQSVSGGTPFDVHPWLKVTLNPSAPIFPYDELSGLVMKRVSLEVEVNGLRTLGLENEQGPLDPGKPFPIFGTTPRKGSYLLLGSDELWNKPLDEIDLQLHWANLPQNGLDAYYSAYKVNKGETQLLDGISFRAIFSEKSKFRWHPIQRNQDSKSGDASVPADFHVPQSASRNGEDSEDKSFQLFDCPADARAAPVVVSEWRFRLGGLSHSLKPPENIPPRYSQSIGTGFFRLELSAPLEGFGQDLYPRILAEVLRQPLPGVIDKVTKGVAKIMTQAVQSALKVAAVGVRKLKNSAPVVVATEDTINGTAGMNPEIPQPPFVPLLANATVSYRASAEILWHADDIATSKNGTEFDAQSQLYRVDPLSGGLVALNNDFMLERYAADGYLRIGLAGVTAGETISLLFMMEATGVDAWQNTQEDEAWSQRLTWSYLSQDRWVKFTPNSVLNDKTLGFSRTGIVELSLPRDIRDDNNVMTPGLYWLSISVENPDDYGNMIGIIPNAVMATRQLDPTQQNSFAALSLEAGSITGLSDKHPAIKAVVQPTASFGGRAAETTPDFRMRVSERLSHKQRAITPSDYEKLVLQAFSEISDVKCITGVPGQVTLVVSGRRVPMSDVHWAIKNSIVPEHRLKAIGDFLRPLIPPSVAAENLIIRNLRYEQVRVVLNFKLVSEVEEARFTDIELLIAKYISPWLFDTELPVPIGSGGLDAAELITDLQNETLIGKESRLSFVHLLSFKSGDGPLDYWAIEDTAREDATRKVTVLNESVNETITNKLQFEVFPASPWSVLVPAPHHKLRLIKRDEETNLTPVGVGDFEIGRDLVIGRDRAQSIADELERADSDRES